MRQSLYHRTSVINILSGPSASPETPTRGMRGTLALLLLALHLCCALQLNPTPLHRDQLRRRAPERHAEEHDAAQSVTEFLEGHSAPTQTVTEFLHARTQPANVHRMPPLHYAPARAGQHGMSLKEALACARRPLAKRESE